MERREKMDNVFERQQPKSFPGEKIAVPTQEQLHKKATSIMMI
jgi:hypothetical protein